VEKPMGVIAKGIFRGYQGLFTPVSLRYPLSVFNKKLYSQALKSKDTQFAGVKLPKCPGSRLPTVYLHPDPDRGVFVFMSEKYDLFAHEV